MTNAFHSLKGRFDLESKNVGIDYARLHNPIDAEGTLAHELAHFVMNQTTDFGQVTQNVYQSIDNFTLSKLEVEKIAKSIYNAQYFVQEGIATTFEISRIHALIGKQQALHWAKQSINQGYWAMFQRLFFAFDLSSAYRDYFFGKIPHLVLETNLRVDMYELDLLESSDKLTNYLQNDNKNPDKRLEKIIEVLKHRRWVVTRPLEEIAEICGIELYKPATKEQVASYLSYLTSKTKNPRTFSAEEVGDSPQGGEAFQQAYRNLTVANMNLNIPETALVNFDQSVFKFYSDKMKVVFLSPMGPSWKSYQFVEQHYGYSPDFGLLGFYANGDKHIGAFSYDEIQNVLVSELQHATLLVKWRAHDLTTQKLVWNKIERLADVVVYNHPEDLIEKINELNPLVKVPIKYMTAQFTERHPFLTLFVKMGNDTIHLINSYGNVPINKATNLLKEKMGAQEMSATDLLPQKEHVNNVMSVWMGLPWEIDWVSTMAQGGKEFKIRENQ